MNGVDVTSLIANQFGYIKVLLTSWLPGRNADQIDIKDIGVELMAKSFNWVELVAETEEQPPINLTNNR